MNDDPLAGISTADAAGISKRQPLPIGAEEASASNRTFVNLRIGKIAQTSKDPLPGFEPAKTVNKSGVENHFFAKSYDHITGYVSDIRWHTHTLNDGTVLSGWNITIETNDKAYVLGVSSKDRPFQRVMNVLINVDFSLPVMFVGFMGKNQSNNQPQKVLLLSQEMSSDGKPMWLSPAVEERWLSRSLINKLKENIPLTEAEERNVSRMQDGSFNKDYPYIVENVDGTWSFDTYNNFLHEQMREHVIPNVKACAELRGVHVAETVSMPEFSGSLPSDVLAPDPSVTVGSVRDDDDIPF